MLRIPMSLAAALGLLVATHALPADAAIMPGQIDDFESGSLQNWQAGGAMNPNGPMNVATGGPAGVDDNFLRLTSTGFAGPGSKLVVFNLNQWAGDYLAASVGSIQMQVNNLGATNLVLRLIFEDTAFRSVTTLGPVNVPAGSGWNSVTFSLDASNLTGGVFNTVMANVRELNLVHSPNVIVDRSLSPNIAAQLGVDNITAVPLSGQLSEWNVDANGNWSQGSNWSGSVPNSAGAGALFGDIIAQPRTVTVDGPITVGRIDFDNANAYTIAGTNAVTLDATDGDVQINVENGSHTISAPVTLADNTVITVTPATSNLAITGAISAQSVNVAKAGAGTLTVNNVRAAGLAINGGSVAIAPGGTPAGTSDVGALSIAGATDAWTARYDLNDNDAVVRSTAANKDADFARLYNQIKSGYAGGIWNGTGITSAAAAANPNFETGVAMVDNAVFGFTDFSGRSVNADSILLKYTFYGDIDVNGQVDADDLTVFANNFGRTSGAGQVDGDIDFDGDVDADDLTVFANNFGKGIGNPLSAGPAAAVPEPTTLILAASAGLLCLPIRRRFGRPVRRQRAGKSPAESAIDIT